MRIDFGRASSDYVSHRIDFAPKLFERLNALGIGLARQRILDVGAGTGLFAEVLAKNGCDVTLLDPSHALLQHAGVSQRVVATAEAIPFDAGSFDVATAAQCWHWLDREIAPREISRVLQPGGALAVIYQTYIPMPNSIAAATEKLILKHNPGWRHANSTGINGQVLRDMQAGGFEQIESFSFDQNVQFSHIDWRGFIRTTSPVGASMTAEQLEVFDGQHAELLLTWPEQLTIPHRIFAAIARKAGSRI